MNSIEDLLEYTEQNMMFARNSKDNCTNNVVSAYFEDVEGIYRDYFFWINIIIEKNNRENR